jgi:hypothetical protein
LLSLQSPRTWTYEGADLDGDRLLVRFRLEPESDRVRRWREPPGRFGVHYSLADFPRGPVTGLPCTTPDEWAEEIGWGIDEQIDTGGIGRAKREPLKDGLVLLRWR